MCGITGFWSGRGDARLQPVIEAMTSRIAHRGPDDSATWVDRETGLALGHRRLAIVDLSPAGRQPMTSASGRYTTVYNGEIYNHRELRAELDSLGFEGPWRGYSDTEVMLAAFDRWGIPKALERLIGMFALAVWDRKEKVLTLARDRLGEKPLHYGRAGTAFLFGSELKALAAHPDFPREVDRGVLAAFLRRNHVPAPHSIWTGIHKLPPAHYLEVRDAGRIIGRPVPYWDFARVATEGAAHPLPDSLERIDELESLLKDAVGRQMQADVPLGAFLSGGIDSSLIVSLMQAQSAEPVRTFTIGFSEGSYDEATHARAVAAHLGTRHTEHYVTPEDILAVVPKLPVIWDEPFSDASQIPTFLVSEITRRDVTVSLSGDGGDELFGGYNRHVAGKRLWDAAGWLPAGMRRGLAAALRHPATGRVSGDLMRMLPRRWRISGMADRLPKVARLLEADSAAAVYRQLVSHQIDPERYVIGGIEAEGMPAEGEPDFADMRQSMMYLDTLTYLPDDILVKVDRASMAVSLESRVPFLDHRVVEYAWRLPLSLKFRGGKGKHILREILFRHVPREIVERPKTGFTPPIGQWLAGPLRPWAEDLLDETRLRRDGFFDVARVRQLWAEHLAGHRRQEQLWDVLMFQAWWAETGRSASSADQDRARKNLLYA